MNYMNNKSNQILDKDHLWCSQFDMVLTQWAFIGPLVLFPQKCGLHKCSDKDLELVIYLWRILGYVNGIDERFNICSGTLEECKAWFTIILEKIFKPTIVVSDTKIGYEMCHGIAKTSVKNKAFDTDAFLKHWFKAMDVPVKINLHKISSKFKYQLLKFFTNFAFQSEWMHHMTSKKYYKDHTIIAKKKSKYESRLQKKYSHLKYEESCPFHVTFTEMRKALGMPEDNEAVN